MRSFFQSAVQFSVFLALGTLATTTASAQDPSPTISDDSKVPTFTRSNPAAPSPSIVVQVGTPVTGVAKVLPPPPRIVSRANGRITIPGGAAPSSGAYRAQAASLTSPLKVNSAFGPRGGRRHNGIDFDGDTGDSVGASLAGTIAFAGVKRGYGNLLIVDHGNGVSTYYAHLSAMYVAEGQQVATGQIIGAVGSTGRSSGPHLHYEVRIDGKPINPTSLISFDGGQVLVNGRVFGAEDVLGEDDAVATSEPAEETARPRRVTTEQPAVKVPGVIYVGESKLSVQ